MAQLMFLISAGKGAGRGTVKSDARVGSSPVETSTSGFCGCRILFYGEGLGRMISSTDSPEGGDVRALKRARAAARPASELLPKGVRVVSLRDGRGAVLQWSDFCPHARVFKALARVIKRAFRASNHPD